MEGFRENAKRIIVELKLLDLTLDHKYGNRLTAFSVETGRYVLDVLDSIKAAGFYYSNGMKPVEVYVNDEAFKRTRSALESATKEEKNEELSLLKHAYSVWSERAITVSRIVVEEGETDTT